MIPILKEADTDRGEKSSPGRTRWTLWPNPSGPSWLT